MSVLVHPITGRLGSLLGDAWVGLLRESPDDKLVKESAYGFRYIAAYGERAGGPYSGTLVILKVS